MKQPFSLRRWFCGTILRHRWIRDSDFAGNHTWACLCGTRWGVRGGQSIYNARWTSGVDMASPGAESQTFAITIDDAGDMTIDGPLPKSDR